ncbi:MAG: hypothetical protein AAGC44_04055 [Planctomycetota bacterium]
MQLLNPQRGTSFYESFSDLIFGTLIIFLVVVLALMVRLKVAQDNRDDDLDQEIAMNQYAGGASQTDWAMSFVLIQGEPRLAIYPRDAWSKIGVVRFEESNPVLSLAELFVKDPALIPTFDIEAFRGLTNGMSFRLWKGAVIITGLGDILTRMYAVQEAEGGALNGWSAQRLVEAVGGIDAGTHVEDDRPTPAAAQARDDYYAFLAGPNEALPNGHPDQFFRQYDQLTEPIEPALEPTKNLPPRILFSVEGEGRVRLGRAVLTAAQFRGLLDSLSVGKGFVLEYEVLEQNKQYDDNGNEVLHPPSWVIKEVLLPAGFDRRLPTAEALEYLDRQRAKERE